MGLENDSQKLEIKRKTLKMIPIYKQIHTTFLDYVNFYVLVQHM